MKRPKHMWPYSIHMLLIKRSMKGDEAKLLQATSKAPKASKCYPAVVCDATCYLDVLPHQSTPPTAPRRRTKTQINIFYCDAFTLIVDTLIYMAQLVVVILALSRVREWQTNAPAPSLLPLCACFHACFVHDFVFVLTPSMIIHLRSQRLPPLPPMLGNLVGW